MSAETLEQLTRLVEGLEELLDPEDQGIEIDYRRLQCKCGKASCFSMERYNNVLMRLWDARAHVDKTKEEIALVRKLIGCRRPGRGI
jgi:hypothetical protein